MFQQPPQADEGDDRKWRHFVALFLGVLLGGTAAVYLFVLLVDPYNVVPTSLPLDRRIVSISQRHMFPQIMRSQRFDSLILGTSTTALLDPELLSKKFGVRFANLAMSAATAWEQNTVLDYFQRKAGPPKAVIIGLDGAWCDQNADRARVTFRGFPYWLYDDEPWNDYFNLFNSETVLIAVRLVGYQLGVYRERMRYDGYHVFVPPEATYDLAQARRKIWGTQNSEVPPDVPPLSLLSNERGTLSFPALTWLDASLAKLPWSTLKILAFMPVHIAAQPRPGTHGEAIEAECKARITDIARKRGANAVDWRIYSDLTRNDANYWDPVHYRVPIASQIAEELGQAVLQGSASPHSSYRILVP
jgi:hypothetical protein